VIHKYCIIDTQQDAYYKSKKTNKQTNICADIGASVQNATVITSLSDDERTRISGEEIEGQLFSVLSWSSKSTYLHAAFCNILSRTFCTSKNVKYKKVK
jgi:hypothetical protein